MDKKFKWNMFITSFIPLWLSIMVSDIWNIAESGIKTWRRCDSICMNVFNICRENWVCVFVVLVIGILMLTSSISINRFLRDKKRNNTPHKVKIKKSFKG